MKTLHETFQRNAGEVVSECIRAQAKASRQAMRALIEQPGPAEVLSFSEALTRVLRTINTYEYLFSQKDECTHAVRVLKRFYWRCAPLLELDTTYTWIERQLRRQRALKSETGSLLCASLRAEREVEVAKLVRFCRKRQSRFRKMLRSLVESLATKDKASKDLIFGEALNRAMLLHAANVDISLRKITQKYSSKQIKRLRKSIESLRYALEPWETEQLQLRPIQSRLRAVLEMLHGLNDSSVLEGRLLIAAAPIGADFASTLAERLLFGELPADVVEGERKTYPLDSFLGLCTAAREEHARLAEAVVAELDTMIKKKIVVPLEAWITALQAQNRVPHAATLEVEVASRLFRVK